MVSLGNDSVFVVSSLAISRDCQRVKRIVARCALQWLPLRILRSLSTCPFHLAFPITLLHNADHYRDLWDVTFAKLPGNDQQALRSGLGIPVTVEDVRASIAEARAKADKKWTIKGQRGDINLRVHFDKVVHWVQEFVAIGDTIVTYDPGHAALPWAAVRFLLQVC